VRNREYHYSDDFYHGVANYRYVFIMINDIFGIISPLCALQK